MKLFLGILLFFSVSAVDFKAAKADPRCSMKKAGEAYVMIQNDVRRGLRLFSSSVQFPPAADKVVLSSDCKYVIFGRYEAQNAYGAMIPGSFLGTIKYFPESGSWQTLHVTHN